MKNIADKTYLSAIHQSNNTVFLRISSCPWAKAVEIPNLVSSEIDFLIHRELDEYLVYYLRPQLIGRWI